MTIALIAYYLGPRLGIGNYINQLSPLLVPLLRQQDKDIKILSSPNAAKNTPALNYLSDYVEILPELDFSPLKRYFWLATKFSKYCRENDIKLVVWLSNPVILPWHPASIAVIHDVTEWKAKEKYGSRFRTALRSWLYLDNSILFSKKIIVVSQATKNDLFYFRPHLKKQRKTEVISNGVDSTLTSRSVVDISALDVPFLLSVGRIDPVAKRLPEAVSLVKALRQKSGESWQLQLVGGMNSSTQKAGESFLESTSDLDWVHYQGHVSDDELAQWYRRSSGVVFLSDNEGFGCPIAEAASFRKWVIVNQANEAAAEVGKGSIIPIDLKESQKSAIKVLHQLSSDEEPKFNDALPTWDISAQAYANVIASILQN
ncbi:MAG: glycosyltransferase [Cyanobacteria bacterium P01_D01_bin.156]